MGSEPMRVSRRTASTITRGEKAVAATTMLAYALHFVSSHAATAPARHTTGLC